MKECCSGCTGIHGQPLPCCVLCERRIVQKGQRVVWREYIQQRLNGGEWVCSGRLAYVDPAGTAKP